MKAVFMGSFQPVTNGHVDIITRASRLCDAVFAVVGYNPEKPLLVPVSARERWLKQAVSHLNNVRVESFAGALADFCVQVGADCIIKSVRNASDFCLKRIWRISTNVCAESKLCFCLRTKNIFIYRPRL